jgi:hypothetical protein
MRLATGIGTPTAQLEAGVTPATTFALSLEQRRHGCSQPERPPPASSRAPDLRYWRDRVELWSHEASALLRLGCRSSHERRLLVTRLPSERQQGGVDRRGAERWGNTRRGSSQQCRCEEPRPDDRHHLSACTPTVRVAFRRSRWWVARCVYTSIRSGCGNIRGDEAVRHSAHPSPRW